MIQAANLRAFEAILVTELLPLVKQRYRVSTDAWISGSLVPSSFEGRFGPALGDHAAGKRDHQLIWVGCGSDDIFFGGAKEFAARPHSMTVARQELAELLPLLFQRRH